MPCALYCNYIILQYSQFFLIQWCRKGGGGAPWTICSIKICFWSPPTLPSILKHFRITSEIAKVIYSGEARDELAITDKGRLPFTMGTTINSFQINCVDYVSIICFIPYPFWIWLLNEWYASIICKYVNTCSDSLSHICY